MVEQTSHVCKSTVTWSNKQELYSTFLIVVGKLFDMILGNRNYVRPCVSDGKVVRLDFGQQELCSTLFLVVGKLFDLILGNRNYVRPCFKWWESCST